MRGELKNNALNSTLDECGEGRASNHISKQKMRSWLCVLLVWWGGRGVGPEGRGARIWFWGWSRGDIQYWCCRQRTEKFGKHHQQHPSCFLKTRMLDLAQRAAVKDELWRTLAVSFRGLPDVITERTTFSGDVSVCVYFSERSKWMIILQC